MQSEGYEDQSWYRKVLEGNGKSVPTYPLRLIAKEQIPSHRFKWLHAAERNHQHIFGIIVIKRLHGSKNGHVSRMKLKNEKGVQVMVGYMRRYAPAYLAALEEVGKLDKIYYVKIKDIIGQNHLFI